MQVISKLVSFSSMHETAPDPRGILQTHGMLKIDNKKDGLYRSRTIELGKPWPDAQTSKKVQS